MTNHFLQRCKKVLSIKKFFSYNYSYYICDYNNKIKSMLNYEEVYKFIFLIKNTPF